MNKNFEIITVNYRTADLIKKLVDSINAINNTIPIRVMDGSDCQPFINEIVALCLNYPNVTLERQGWNLHHGPSMHKALMTSKYEWCLIMDSDTELLNGMLEKFHFTHFYEGFCCQVDANGMNVKSGITYVHPEIMLVNVEKYRQSPYNCVRHGAPMLSVMMNVPDEDKLCLPDEYRKYYKRIGRGTCGRWGYQI